VRDRRPSGSLSNSLADGCSGLPGGAGSLIDASGSIQKENVGCANLGDLVTVTADPDDSVRQPARHMDQAPASDVASDKLSLPSAYDDCVPVRLVLDAGSAVSTGKWHGVMVANAISNPEH
jgi:hypothetical protein